jgi:hypothetical protein
MAARPGGMAVRPGGMAVRPGGMAAALGGHASRRVSPVDRVRSAAGMGGRVMGLPGAMAGEVGRRRGGVVVPTDGRCVWGDCGRGAATQRFHVGRVWDERGSLNEGVRPTADERGRSPRKNDPPDEMPGERGINPGEECWRGGDERLLPEELGDLRIVGGDADERCWPELGPK